MLSKADGPHVCCGLLSILFLHSTQESGDPWGSQLHYFKILPCGSSHAQSYRYCMLKDNLLKLVHRTKLSPDISTPPPVISVRSNFRFHIDLTKILIGIEKYSKIKVRPICQQAMYCHTLLIAMVLTLIPVTPLCFIQQQPLEIL